MSYNESDISYFDFYLNMIRTVLSDFSYMYLKLWIELININERNDSLLKRRVRAGTVIIGYDKERLSSLTFSFIFSKGECLR